MNLVETLRLIILPILFTAIGEFLLKLMMNRSVETMVQLWVHPGVFLAFSLIILGGVMWLYAMSKVHLSFMYPFMSLNYVVILFGSEFGLHESVSWYRYSAVGLIVLGLLLVSRSPNIKVD